VKEGLCIIVSAYTLPYYITSNIKLAIRLLCLYLQIRVFAEEFCGWVHALYSLILGPQRHPGRDYIWSSDYFIKLWWLITHVRFSSISPLDLSLFRGAHTSQVMWLWTVELIR